MNYAHDIKTKLSTKEVFERYGIKVNRKGFACCPFHNEKTASMKVYPGDRGYFCFGCGAQGDIFSFVSNLFGLSFPQALRKLNDDFCLGLPIDADATAEQRKAASERYERFRREQEAIKRKREGLKSARDEAFDWWAKLDIVLRKYAPKDEFEPPNEAFMYAAHHIGIAEYELDKAETALYLFDIARKNNEQRNSPNNTRLQGGGLRDVKAV